MQKETPSQTQEQLSWRTGILMFRDQTLAEAAAEFNRYNERKLVIKDPAIANLKIEGNFRATNVDAFVRLARKRLSRARDRERYADRAQLELMVVALQHIWRDEESLSVYPTGR